MCRVQGAGWPAVEQGEGGTSLLAQGQHTTGQDGSYSWWRLQGGVGRQAIMTTAWNGESGGEGGERGAGAEDRVQEDWSLRGNRFGPGVGCRLGGEEVW